MKTRFKAAIFLSIPALAYALTGDVNMGTVQQASGPPKAIVIPAPSAGQLVRFTGNALSPVEAVSAGPILATNQQLASWVNGENYELLSITRDGDDVPTTAAVEWPDGVTGTFTRTLKNDTFLAIDSFTITYDGTPTRTVTQAAVTRNGNGAVTVKPALTVAP